MNQGQKNIGAFSVFGERFWVLSDLDLFLIAKGVGEWPGGWEEWDMVAKNMAWYSLAPPSNSSYSRLG